MQHLEQHVLLITATARLLAAFIIHCFIDLSGMKKNLPFLIPIGLGIIISVIVSCVLINYTYRKYPIATLLFFEGLIIGGLVGIIGLALFNINDNENK